MKEKTDKAFNRLEIQKKELIHHYGSLSEDQLCFNPGPGEWNLLQVMRHLVTAEKQSMNYIQRKMESAEQIPKTGTGSVFRFFILKLALILPIKYKAPKIAQVNEDYQDFELMKAEWDDIRDNMKKMIDQSDDQTLAKAVYKHPRAGFLNVKQAIEFMENHIVHHQKQIDRIIKNPSFPVK